VLPALQTVFNENPELIAKSGDMVQHAECALLQLAANSNLLGKEAIHRHMLGLKARLKGTANSELEYLLIDRIAICWLGVNYYEQDAASQLLSEKGQPSEHRPTVLGRGKKRSIAGQYHELPGLGRRPKTRRVVRRSVFASSSSNGSK